MKNLFKLIGTAIVVSVAAIVILGLIFSCSDGRWRAQNEEWLKIRNNPGAYEGKLISWVCIYGVSGSDTGPLSKFYELWGSKSAISMLGMRGNISHYVLVDGCPLGKMTTCGTSSKDKLWDAARIAQNDWVQITGKVSGVTSGGEVFIDLTSIKRLGYSGY